MNVIDNILGKGLKFDVKGKNREDNVLGYTKTGAVVTIESTEGFRNNAFFITKNANAGGRIVLKENLDKIVVQKVNPELWKRYVYTDY
jgi:hypothetical protein